MNYLAVGVGGMAGAAFRYFISTFNGATTALFPFGTLTANFLGCFLLSFVAYASILNWNLPKKYLLAINTGFIGSLTTFSTFSVETMNYIIHAKYELAAIYVIISLAGGLSLSFMGVHLAIVLFRKIQEEQQNT
ncbi:fluoride efflux transporter CrcB [Desulforamulus aquiferis]|uniref:Fluoride-specific ion channel FluC n=1 Tax=Desulforamulus aquiferis TaxID=1397668 RepID=A0AAW7ZEJ0_9FIRM|nr:fluoride efflux transporter CrcB [Desulforamulus aquiferis]MDO7787690.1 fluoride efflux transporter CrcB [Desulforamulus aquiferis]